MTWHVPCHCYGELTSQNGLKSFMKDNSYFHAPAFSRDLLDIDWLQKLQKGNILQKIDTVGLNLYRDEWF